MIHVPNPYLRVGVDVINGVRVDAVLIPGASYFDDGWSWRWVCPDCGASTMAFEQATDNLTHNRLRAYADKHLAICPGER